MFLLFNHLKIFGIFIFERSIFNVYRFGIDLNKFSIKPPPVICAAAFKRFLFAHSIISFEYIFVGFKISFFKLAGNLFFLKYF